MTTNITYTKYTNHKEPLSKQYWLEEDAIQKQASALLYDGSAERITMPFASFAHALKEATSNHAFGYGTYADNYPDKVSIVVNGKEQPDKHILARTTQHIAYTKEAVIMFDYDPSPYGKEMTQQAFIDALTSIHPEIKKAARIIRGSVSAGVYKINEQPSNNKKGFHVYLPVKDGSDIERYGRVLFNKLWLNGHGFIALASNGAMLNRSIIDGAVFSPERLDFVGNPVIKGEGLNYKSIDPVYVMGDYLDTSTLKDLTNDEKIQLDLLINNAKQEIKPLADKTQKTWKNNKVELMVKAGVSEKEAINTINKIFDSSNQNLCGKYLIEFANWVTVTVDDILKDPTTYDNQACADPIEGVGYGKTTAKFYWNNGKPAIHSLAHGQSLTYFLNSSQAESTFNEILDTEITYSHVDLLKYVDDNHKLKAISLQIAAEAHLPVNTVFIAGLSVYSSMLARKYVVNYENNYPLPIGIYSVLEQPSGTGKTRCLDTFQRPFYEIQKRLRKQASENLKPLIDLEEKGEKLTDEQTEEKDLLLKALKNLKEALFVTNSTPEALEKTLNNTLGFFSAISSEQGLFNSLLGNSYKSQGNSNNNDVMLNGFDGGYVNSIRVTRDGFNGKVVGAVCCFAQSGSIENVLNASNGTGVSERFLMLAEPHNLGKRDHTRKIQRDPFIEVNYANS